ncbi:MAG: hypothetical protein VB855_11125 [Pirellulaceae bacterium]
MDYGDSWQKITNGIRDNDYTWVIREDPVRPGLLYAGAETGAYVSFDDGGIWQSLQNKLPPVIVMNMQVKDDDLVVATHGRGFWILDNISSLRTLTPEVASSQAHLFEVAPAFRNVRSGYGWTKLRYGAKNPLRGVMFEYYLAEPAVNPLTITVTEANGEVIKEFTRDPGKIQSPSAKAGMNRFSWDMRYPGTEMPMPSGAMDAFTSVDITGANYLPPTSPFARPGQYRVRLMVDGETREQPFEIRMDSRFKASDEDLALQFDLMVDIRDLAAEVVDTLLRIREARRAVEDGRIERQEESSEEADAILKELRQIEGLLMVWAGTEAHPMMFSPPGLTEKLNSLANAVSGSDAKPTASMYAVFEDLATRFEIQRNRLQQVVGQ